MVIGRTGSAMLATLTLIACAHTDAPLAVGTPAPAFALTAHDGKRVALDEQRGHWVVLYFYPKDDTSGCTKEACAFRDAWPRLLRAGVAVFGVSTQDNASHAAFAARHALPFPLLPDERGELAARYHVPVVVGMARRMTYLIDGEGRVARVWPKVDPTAHVGEILSELESRAR